MSKEIDKENVSEKEDLFADLAAERSVFEQYRKINTDIGKVVGAITYLTTDIYTFDLEEFFKFYGPVFSLFGRNDQLFLRAHLLKGMKKKLHLLENELSELKLKSIATSSEAFSVDKRKRDDD